MDESADHWNLVKWSAHAADARRYDDTTLRVHASLLAAARQRNDPELEYRALVRCAKVFERRRDYRSMLHVADQAVALAGGPEAEGIAHAARRALAGLDDLERGSRRFAEQLAVHDRARTAHIALMEVADRLGDREAAYESRVRLGDLAQATGDRAEMRRWWDESYARAEPVCNALRPDEHAAGSAGRDDADLREASIASDAAAASERTGPDGIAAHHRFFVASVRLGDHRAGALAAGRHDRAYEARGEFDAMLRWATEATRWRRSNEADNRHRHAKRLRELERALLPALKHLNDPAAYVHVGKAHRRAERLSEATVVYLRGRADFPESPALLNALAGALREAGEAPLARAQVARSLELDPSIKSNRAAHTVVGFLLCDQRDVAQARELGLRLAAAHPTDSRVYGLLLYASLIAGHAEEAARLAALAQRYAKDDFDVVPWLCRLRTSYREARDVAVVRALDTVIDHVKRLRGQEIWEGSLGVPFAD